MSAMKVSDRIGVGKATPNSDVLPTKKAEAEITHHRMTLRRKYLALSTLGMLWTLNSPCLFMSARKSGVA